MSPAHFGRSRLVTALLVVALPGLSTACATQQANPGATADPMASVAPMLSVERFLQAANARDYDAMGRLFGTHEGPTRRYDRRELEIVMQTMAEVLRHEDFEITSDRRAPGREHPTNRIGVNLTKNGRLIPDVPFFVVQTDDALWLIEEVDLEVITSR